MQQDTQAFAFREIPETLFENLPGIAYRGVNDRPRSMVFVSDGFEALSAYSRDCVSGSGFAWTDLVHPDDLSALTCAIDAAVASQAQFDVQYRIITKLGQEKWVRERGLALGSNENGFQILEGYIDDITLIRNAALAFAASEKFYEDEIRQRHEVLSASIDSAPLGVLTWRTDGAIQRSNDVLCQLLGYSKLQLEKMSVLDLTQDTDKAEILAFLSSVKTGEFYTQVQRTRLIRSDGSPVDVKIVSSAACDGPGSAELILSQISDLTAQLKVQAEIRHQHLQLAHADRLHMLGEMSTGLAHEINQPLTAISLFAETGRRLLAAHKYDRLAEILTKLSQHSYRAGAIVERMQDMGRRKEGARQSVDLNKLIEDVVLLAEVDAGANEIQIELDLCEGSPMVRVEVVQIHQVVLNLLRNAMDAMQLSPDANVRVIVLKTRDNGVGFFEVSVVDSGAGVPDEAADRLFDSFLTTKRTGLGMGLPISKAIVNAHGGLLSFCNNAHAGATFVFTLPWEHSENHFAE